MLTYNKLKTLFEEANHSFLSRDLLLFDTKVSERTLCGALMLHLHDCISGNPEYESYYTDVEYNLNNGSIKTICKTILSTEMEVIPINCDLILHSRGGHPEQDNLIAIEMKKLDRPKEEKQKDRNRLIALTQDSYDGVWSFDGRVLPEHVCRYVLGIYYEINYSKRSILIEYYKQGSLHEFYCLNY